MDAGSTTSRTRLVAGRYRLLDAVGSGGMGVVWRAEDVRLGRLVAVKEVRPPAGMTGVEYDDLRERTLREARAAARLTTPGAVAVHDVVEEDGRPYVVMELLHGRSLAAVVAEDGPLPPAEVARIGLSLLATLSAAHRAGILHRDVKPANVVLEADGRVVLTDFGIAKTAGDPQLTSTGVLLGSPAYMAPERARGQEAGPPSDLYALGATLFTAVEGRPPFAGRDAMAVLLAVVGGERQPAAAAGPLEPALTRLLDPDPQRRPAAAEAEALLRAAEQQARAADVPAGQPGPEAETRALRQADDTLVVALPGAGAPPGPAAAPPRPAAAAPVPRPAPPGPADRRPRRATGLLALLALLGVLALGGGVLLAGRADDPAAPGRAAGGSDDAGAAGTGTAPDPAAGTGEAATEPTQPGEPTEPTEPAEATEPGAGAGAGEAGATPSPPAPAEAPDGWKTYRDPAGWSLAHPPGWRAETRDVRGERVLQVTSPEGGGRYIRVSDDGRAEGDPAARWRAFAEEFAARNPSYEEIGIDAVDDFRYTPAADWEFTHERDGHRLHVLDRQFFTPDGRAYAVLVQGRDDDEVREVFDGVLESFRPAGG